jgi:hypothetical protein
MKLIYILFCLLILPATTILAQTGVSTTSPSKNLDVNGDMRVRGLSAATQASNDKILTADVNGNVRQLTGYKTTKVGDIKYGLQQADHAGWYLLNGRNVSTLSATAQANAATLSISTLDNVQDRMLRSNTSIGTTGGSNTQVLTLAQIPLYNITGTTASGGGHSHTFADQWFHNYNPEGTSTATSGVGITRQQITETSLTVTTSTNAWAHSHNITAPSGGTTTAFSIEPQYLTANLFIYLGL